MTNAISFRAPPAAARRMATSVSPGGVRQRGLRVGMRLPERPR
jgi:hypothetical protein